MPKGKKNAAATPVEAYEMQKEYSRPTLMTGEYSGINPEDLLGKPTPKVSYPLDQKYLLLLVDERRGGFERIDVVRPLTTPDVLRIKVGVARGEFVGEIV